MALHPEVRTFLDTRRQTDPGIDYGRIGAAELRAGFAIPARPAPAETESLRIEGRHIPTRGQSYGRHIARVRRLFVRANSQPLPLNQRHKYLQGEHHSPPQLQVCPFGVTDKQVCGQSAIRIVCWGRPSFAIDYGPDQFPGHATCQHLFSGSHRAGDPLA